MWYQGHNGYLRDWHFLSGNGAYRESDFDKLYSKQTIAQVRTSFPEPNHLNNNVYVQ